MGINDQRVVFCEDYYQGDRSCELRRNLVNDKKFLKSGELFFVTELHISGYEYFSILTRIPYEHGEHLI